MVKTEFPKQGVWVQSMVEELRSHSMAILIRIVIISKILKAIHLKK